MLDRARAAVPSAAFREGELTSLPLDAETVDLAICALALEHVAGLDNAIAELARVLRPGGRAIISELHPVVRALGGCAYFQDARGAAGIVRGHSHLHGDYLRAFDAARLTVRACHEPRFGRDEAAMQGPAAQFVPAAADAAYVGLPGALIWDLERGDGARS
jgi:SAM-dependent methyltransferase